AWITSAPPELPGELESEPREDVVHDPLVVPVVGYVVVHSVAQADVAGRLNGAGHTEIDREVAWPVLITGLPDPSLDQHRQHPFGSAARYVGELDARAPVVDLQISLLRGVHDARIRALEVAEGRPLIGEPVADPSPVSQAGVELDVVDRETAEKPIREIGFDEQVPSQLRLRRSRPKARENHHSRHYPRLHSFTPLRGIRFIAVASPELAEAAAHRIDRIDPQVTDCDDGLRRTPLPSGVRRTLYCRSAPDSSVGDRTAAGPRGPTRTGDARKTRFHTRLTGDPARREISGVSQHPRHSGP